MIWAWFQSRLLQSPSRNLGFECNLYQTNCNHQVKFLLSKQSVFLFYLSAWLSIFEIQNSIWDWNVLIRKLKIYLRLFLDLLLIVLRNNQSSNWIRIPSYLFICLLKVASNKYFTEKSKRHPFDLIIILGSQKPIRINYTRNSNVHSSVLLRIKLLIFLTTFGSISHDDVKKKLPSLIHKGKTSFVLFLFTTNPVKVGASFARFRNKRYYSSCTLRFLL